LIIHFTSPSLLREKQRYEKAAEFGEKAATSERTGIPELSEHIRNNNTSIRCMGKGIRLRDDRMYMYGQGGGDIQVRNVVVGIGCAIGRGWGWGKWMYKIQSVIQQQEKQTVFGGTNNKRISVVKKR
jgi:hypothetical protein